MEYRRAAWFTVLLVLINLVGDGWSGRPVGLEHQLLLLPAAALFFFAGIQIFFMGLLGEYILAIYGQVRKKPLVIERERINFPAKE